jgi:hypothetical protein
MASEYLIDFTDKNVLRIVRIEPYTINGPASPTDIVLDSFATSAATSLRLPGKRMPNYGEIINENLVHLLENFHGENEPTYVIGGQLWYDRSNDPAQLKILNTRWRMIKEDVDNVGDISYFAITPKNPSEIPALLSRFIVGYKFRIYDVVTNIDDQQEYDVITAASPNGNGDIAFQVSPVPDASKVNDWYIGGWENVLLNNSKLIENLDANGFTITGIDTPLNNLDASNKEYVDTQIGANLVTTIGGLDDVALSVSAPIQGGSAADRDIIQYNGLTQLWESDTPENYGFITENGGSISGPNGLSFSNNARIEDLLDPINPQDAATKAYVDVLTTNTVGGLSDVTISGGGPFINDFLVYTGSTWENINKINLGLVEVSGGTLTGQLILDGPPLSGLAAATKDYVDTTIGGSPSTLDALTDTNIVAVSVDDLLYYDGTEWINRSYLSFPFLQLTGGTLTGQLILDGPPLSGLAAATKDYVDASIGSVPLNLNALTDVTLTSVAFEDILFYDGVSWINQQYTTLPFLQLTGGTLTGQLILDGPPLSGLAAATRDYVDDNFLSLAGGTLGGTLTLSTAPSGIFEAANKGYVDDVIISSATYDSLTDELLLSSNILPDVVATGFQTSAVLPASNNIFHSIKNPNNKNVFNNEDGLFLQKSMENNETFNYPSFTLDNVLTKINKALGKWQAPKRQIVFDANGTGDVVFLGSGTTVTNQCNPGPVDIDLSYVVGMHNLSVYVDGIKQISSESAYVDVSATFINYPIINLSTANTFVITNVDLILNTITVSGDQTSFFIEDTDALISGSTGNDGTYRITNVEFTTDTVITFGELLSDPTVDGDVSSSDSITIDEDKTGIIRLLSNEITISGNSDPINNDQYNFSVITYDDIGDTTTIYIDPNSLNSATIDGNVDLSNVNFELWEGVDTGLDDLTNYYFRVSVDGGSDIEIEVSGEEASKLKNLETYINAQSDTNMFGFGVIMFDGALKFYSNTKGSSSSIALTDGPDPGGSNPTGDSLFLNLSGSPFSGEYTITSLSAGANPYAPATRNYNEEGRFGTKSDRFTFNVIPTAGATVEVIIDREIFGD